MISNTCVIYARFSSVQQRDASIEQQERVCRAYASQKGYKVLRVYADRAITGRTDQRPQFQQMIKDAAAGDFCVVLVYALDRFSRDKYDSAVYKHELKKHNVRVVSATEPISDDPAGILLESVLEGLAQYYTAELSQKIRRGYEDNARKLLAPGSVPFGYRRSASGQYEIYEPEAEIVREIFQRVADGEIYADIARDLNARGLRTSKGAAWNKNSFRTMLSNIRYTGTYISKFNLVENAIPQIISKEVFYKVKTVIPQHKPSRRHSDNGYYSLSGRLFCGSCGKPMNGISGTARNGTLCFYYACAGHRAHTCDQQNLRRDDLEELIASALWDDVLSDDCITWMAETTVAHQAEDFQQDDLDLLQAELNQTKKEKANVLKAIAAGIFTDGTRDLLLSLEHKEAELSALLDASNANVEQLPTTDDIISYLQLFREGSVDQPFTRQGILDAFVTRAEVHPDHVTVFFNIKKEDRQKDVPFTDPLSEPDGSSTLDKWSCGEPKRTVYYINDFTFALIIRRTA